MTELEYTGFDNFSDLYCFVLVTLLNSSIQEFSMIGSKTYKDSVWPYNQGGKEPHNHRAIHPQ